jgi:outer membrane lipoprotein carrier protein
MIRLFVIGLLFAIPALPAAQAQQPPEAIARALQARYQGIRDFSADFVQTYRGGVLKTQTQERGTVAVKKPGRMRWVYTSPERKELVSDGRKIYWYVPADKQVLVNDMPADNQASTPALFLSGKGDIVRDFTASYAEGAPAGTVALKLVPRRAEPEYEHLVVTLDPVSLQIRSLTTKDRQGGESTVTLTNMKENRGLSDKDFVFRIPRGVDVVTDGTR